MKILQLKILVLAVVLFKQSFFGGLSEVEVQQLDLVKKDQELTKNSKLEEMILVISANAIEPVLADVKDGFLKADSNLETSIEKLIDQNKAFVKRGLAEQDGSIKQIIPYFILVNENNEIFVVQRKDKGQITEGRLAGKLSCGIGGHLNQSDLGGKKLFDLGVRELFEEVQIEGCDSEEDLRSLKHEFLGVIYDPGSGGLPEAVPVGFVHFGLCFKVFVKGSVSPRSEFKSGQFRSKKDLLSDFDRWESWSTIALQAAFLADPQK